MRLKPAQLGCAALLVAMLLAATYGLDLSPGFFYRQSFLGRAPCAGQPCHTPRRRLSNASDEPSLEADGTLKTFATALFSLRDGSNDLSAVARGAKAK
jgi:hypothetical protein